MAWLVEGLTSCKEREQYLTRGQKEKFGIDGTRTRNFRRDRAVL